MKLRLMSSVLALAVMSGAVLGQEVQGPPAPTAADQGLAPRLLLVSPPLDLGVGTPGSFPQGTVTLVNNTEKEMEITGADGECACTHATILGSTGNAKTLKPGETMDVLIAVDLPREVGDYVKRVYIRENGVALPHEVPVSFQVGYPVKVNGSTRVPIITEIGGVLELESSQGRSFRVLSVHGRDPEFRDFDPEKDPVRSQYSLVYNLRDRPVPDPPRWVIIETDHPLAEMMAIPSFIEGTKLLNENRGSWRAVDKVLTLGAIPPDHPTRASLTFSGKAVIPGAGLRVLSSAQEVTVQVIEARRPDRGGGMTVDFNVIPRGGFRGFVETTLTFEYDGASASIDLYARVKSGIRHNAGQKR